MVAFIAFFQWGKISHLKYEVDNIKIRLINLQIIDKDRNLIPEANISVEPQYSFEEVKPKYKIIIVGTGQVRLAVTFSGAFKLKIGASGYRTKEVEYSNKSLTEMTIQLDK